MRSCRSSWGQSETQKERGRERERERAYLDIHTSCRERPVDTDTAVQANTEWGDAELLLLLEWVMFIDGACAEPQVAPHVKSQKQGAGCSCDF